jgi:hypothetical protein
MFIGKKTDKLFCNKIKNFSYIEILFRNVVQLVELRNKFYICIKNYFKFNKMNKINDILLIAKNKGYYADTEGNIFSSKNKIALRKSQNRYFFSIRYYGSRESIPVHKFIAYLKYGDKIFEDGIEVRHLDNNSLNNSNDNISIGTHSENMQDMPINNRIKKAIHASSKNRRFSDDEVKQILNDRNSGMTYENICLKYNTSKSTLNYFFNKAYYSGVKNIE